MAKAAKGVKHTHQKVREYALSLPEAWPDSPWGEDSVVKVRKKIFIFLGSGDAEPLYVSVKLPASAEHALSLPDAVPTAYGLGRSSWVTVRLGADGTDNPPLDVLIDWVEESYRAVAPKTLAAQLTAAQHQPADPA